MPISSAPDAEAPVLLTGASGELGRRLAAALAGRWRLRLTDIVAFPDELPTGASFTRADLADAEAIGRLAEGCAGILHFGGIATEAPFQALMGANLAGVFNVYEAARRHSCRVVFASSNHTIGFHERSDMLDADCLLRPDSLYGLSKAYGELLAGLYWEKHAVQSVLIRIGSCFAAPRNDRMLSTWLSFEDLAELAACALTSPEVGCTTIWGASDNSRSWWRRDGRATLGWRPRNSADAFAAACEGVDTEDALANRYQGGDMCRRDNSRHGAVA